MDQPRLKNEEKARDLTLLEEGCSVIHVMTDLGVIHQVIDDLKRDAATLPPGVVPHRKPSGRKKFTSLRNDKVLRQEILTKPSTTATALKKKYTALLKNVATRTIQHRLRNNLGLPCR